jgi:hypothetical protein
MRSSLGSDEGQGARVQPSCAITDAVPAACPIGQHNGVIHGHSRVHGHTARPAFELTDTPGPEALQAGIPSTSLLDCLGRVRRVKAKPHAVASRALTRRPRPEGRQLSRRTGEDQGPTFSAGRIAVRRAISGPLTPVTRGLSRSLADTSPHRSGHVTGPDGTASQADSAGSIPVTRSTKSAHFINNIRLTVRLIAV